MKNNNVRIEPPKQAGKETELLLQEHKKCSAACSAHIHSAAELLYVREGSYSVFLDNTKYEINEGDLILFCSGAIHSVVAGENERNSYYVIKIPPSFFMDFARRDAGTEYTMRFAVNRKENKCLWTKKELEESKILHVLDELITEFQQKEYASEVAIKLKTMELLLAILRQDAPSEPLSSDRTARIIYELMRYVHEHFADDIDEKALAESYGMSYSYFSRSWRRVTGMTFKVYLNRTRISKAEQMLSANGSSVSDTATACGYNSISYFIRTYRIITGRTPHKVLKQKK